MATPARLLFLLLIAFGGSAAWAQGQGQRYRVSLMTVSTGAELEERLGHTILGIEDLKTRSASSYNFGTFGDPDYLVWRFLHKKLDFWVATMNPGVLAMRYMERQMRVQELALTDRQAEPLASMLAERVLPNHRAFDYDLFENNCVTPVRDALDMALGGALRRHTARPSPYTFRGALMQAFRHEPLLRSLSALIYGPYIDAPRSRWELLFLPDSLHDAVAEMHNLDAPGAPPLVRREKEWRGDMYRPPGALPDPWLFGAAMAFLIAAGSVCMVLPWPAVRTRGRGLLRNVGGLLALVGASCGAVVYYLDFTPHVAFQHNANRFLLSPLDLCALPLLYAGARLHSRGRSILWLLLAATTATAIGHALYSHLFAACRQHHAEVVAWSLLWRAGLLLCVAAVHWRNAAATSGAHRKGI